MGSPLSRRHFLLTSAAVPAASALASAGASPAAGAGRAAAARTPGVRVDTHPLFATAARRHGVPAALLAALSHAQTRWGDHAGRPSASLGYGPMHLVDGAALEQARLRAGKPTGRVVDTLGDAAAATGLGVARLRTDPAANIAGAAALLARHQAAAGRPVGRGTDPGAWYATVAETSGLVTPAAQLDLADAVVRVLTDGGRVELAGGERLLLPARRTAAAPGQRAPLRARVVRARRLARRRDSTDRAEAPPGLDVEWLPAPYEQYGPEPGDYGNHDLARRPQEPAITHVVVHDTEGGYDGVIAMVQDPTYVSWQYTLRSDDGHVAQHVRARDVAWHAGNWWVNMHSIGLEHEGYAAQGAPWYSEPMYRASARLVRYLARRHGIPLDRAHVIGHDQVPGATTSSIPRMHWDPGPFWDWEHYFTLMGAPLRAGTSGRRARPGDVVRILPGFAGNVQPVTGCEDPGDQCGAPRDTNFVTLHTAPSHDAPLVNDVGLHQHGEPATTEVSDISARATAGTELVVAQVRDDWTAVWFLGTTGWFHDPRRRPTARVVERPLGRVRPRSEAPVYGRCYPEPSAYPDPDQAQPVSPLPYRLPAGQEYAVGDLHPPTDYYRAKTFSPDTPGDHVLVRGDDRYVQISLGHRIGFVRLADVELIG